MKRKILEKKHERTTQIAAMEKALEAGDNKAYETAKAAVDTLNGEIAKMEAVETEKARFAADSEPDVPAVGGNAETQKKKHSGWDSIRKMLSGKALAEDDIKIEKALISGDNAELGENYLIPEDVSTEIRELRRNYASARDIVNVVPTDSIAGSTPFEAGEPAGLIDFDDGDSIDDDDDDDSPKFVKKSFKIGFRGKLIPVSRILSNLAKSLLAYLNRWFVRNAVISENKAIFAALKSGYNSGTPKALSGYKALRSSLNRDLDPDCLINGIIVTNQDGFDYFDNLTDANGRDLLQPDPANPTKKTLKGYPIKVYSNKILPNIDETHVPVIYGDTKSGVDFMEYQGLLFDVSEHYLFGKNQNCMRVIEGFDVVSTDTEAYIYGSLDISGDAGANNGGDEGGDEGGEDIGEGGNGSAGGNGSTGGT